MPHLPPTRRYPAIAITLIVVAMTRPPSATASPLVPLLTPGPIADYIFQGDAEDQSPNNLDGAVSGPTLINDRFGEPENTAYHFDGDDDLIEVPNTDDKLTLIDSWSIVAWVRPHAAGTDFRADPIVWKVDIVGRNGDNYYLAWHTGSTFRAGIERKDNDGDFLVLSEPDQPIDTWHQVIAVYDEADLIMYVNGIEQGRTAVGDVTAHNGNAPLRIGNNQHTSHANRGSFNGDIDDVRIFDRALLGSEVATLWTAERVPEPATLALLIIALLPATLHRRRGL